MRCVLFGWLNVTPLHSQMALEGSLTWLALLLGACESEAFELPFFKRKKLESPPLLPPAPALTPLLPPIALTMAGIMLGLVAVVYLISFLPAKGARGAGHWLPSTNDLAKRQFEVWALRYSVFWMGTFAVVIASQMYSWFDEWHYLYLCVGLDLPLLLQPLLAPLPAESTLPPLMRYSLKANVWIAIFAFIGSYWYTHYFYVVLDAQYTMPAHRLNDVPIALYFAAHFYFVSYHTFSNMLLRKIETTYLPGRARSALYWAVVLAFSYFTAYMETLTISSFPDYSFKDRDMVYKLGSAYYALYFVVSFPVFYRVDERVSSRRPLHSMYQVVLEAFGASMMVLCLLDFCRLFVNVPLSIGGAGFYLYKKKA